MADAMSAVLAFFLALFAAIRLARDPGASLWEISGTLVATSGILFVGIVKAYRGRQQEMKFEPLEEPKDLVGWARGLHRQLYELKGRTPDELGVRIVVYKVIWNSRRTEPVVLEQVISYVGGEGGPLGRRLSARAGIIGRVARLGEPYFAKRHSPDLDAYRADLVESWGFTWEEARATSVDTWSSIAYPLLQQDDMPYGVVYMDAKEATFFDDEKVKDIVMNACSLLAATAREVYNRS